MTLYAADITSLAKPVKKNKKTAEKKLEASVPETPTPTPSPVKEKKPPTEKQLAARAKLAESRKRKREEMEEQKKAQEEQKKAEIEIKKKEIESKEKEILEKKKAQAEKRKMKKDLPSPPPSEGIGHVIDKKRKRDDTEPPKWFSKFVESAKLEESKVQTEKRPVKQVKEEAKTSAKEHWQDGFTRDRVNNEVDNHMNRLYSMIFSK